ncbi:MAG: TetR/AcrR family transcriptional regulator [Pseudomonadota bacterium]
MGSSSILETIRKPQIIDAALKTIAERGLQNVTLDNVAQAAGLSKGGVAYYFPSKELLVEHAFVEFFNRIFERGRIARDQQHDPLEKVLSFGWIYDWHDPDVTVGYRLLFDFMSLASQNEKHRAILHGWMDGWVTLLKEALDEGAAAGRFMIDDTESAAKTISAIYQGLATRWNLDPEAHSTEWALSSVREAITRFLSISL